MKLLTKALLFQLAGFAVAALLASGVVWKIAHDLAREEADERLASHAKRLKSWAARASKDEWQHNRQNLSALLQVEFLREGAPVSDDIYKDTVMVPPGYDDVEQCRMLYTSIRIGNKNYAVRLVEEKGEAEVAGQALQIGLLAILLAFGLSTLTIGWISGYRLWIPFRATLQKLVQTRPEERLQLENKTGIAEFDQLNTALNGLSDRQQADRETLRAFARQTAHELRNPLGAARSLAETLMQSKALGQGEASTLSALNQSLSRMERLIRSMLLLARIEAGAGKHYVAGEVDASLALQRQLETSSALLEQKGFILDAHVEDGIRWPMESTLAEVLFSNLLNNALQHGAEGSFSIRLSAAGLEISNPTGYPQMKFPSESNGLGLSIVAAICKQMGWTVRTSHLPGAFHVWIETPNVSPRSDDR